MQGEPAPTPVVVNERAYTIRVRFPRIDSLFTAVDAEHGAGELHRAEGHSRLARPHRPRYPAKPKSGATICSPMWRSPPGWKGLILGSAMKAVQEAIAKLNLPPAIRVEYGGAYEEQQRSFRDLVVVLILAIVLVFIVLLFEFGDFAAPLAILSSALLSTSGVFVALLITGKTFNISSFMGLIMVIGIVAKNGILLLDADKKYRREGMSSEDAMIAAGERRLRPILMTALATIAGMIPLSLAIGAGSQMLQPLAIAVIGGIAASMVLSLIVTPAVNYYLTR